MYCMVSEKSSVPSAITLFKEYLVLTHIVNVVNFWMIPNKYNDGIGTHIWELFLSIACDCYSISKRCLATTLPFMLALSESVLFPCHNLLQLSSKQDKNLYLSY